jgi:glycosyltransferase involved in cell wall biosynthesis
MRFLKCRTSAKIALTFADILPLVSKFTYFEALNYLKTRYIKVIYHGLDTDLFKPYGMKKDNKLIITAGAINRTTILRKGLETFVGCAKYLPDMKFVLHIVINI